jgi:hypothetical protein
MVSSINEEWLKTDLSTPFFGDTVITLTADQNLEMKGKPILSL